MYLDMKCKNLKTAGRSRRGLFYYTTKAAAKGVEGGVWKREIRRRGGLHLRAVYGTAFVLGSLQIKKGPITRLFLNQ